MSDQTSTGPTENAVTAVAHSGDALQLVNELESRQAVDDANELAHAVAGDGAINLASLVAHTDNHVVAAAAPLVGLALDERENLRVEAPDGLSVDELGVDELSPEMFARYRAKYEAKRKQLEAARAALQRRAELTSLVAALVSGGHASPKAPHDAVVQARGLLAAIDFAMADGEGGAA